MDMPVNNRLAEELDCVADESDDELDPELLLAQILSDPHLRQHLVRTERDGVDSITTYNRCEFALGQQRFIWHLSFLPPFSSLPEIEARALDNLDLRVRVTDRQKFGARLEIVLPSPSVGNLTVLVEAMATASSENKLIHPFRLSAHVHE